jgi:hypothetical protein
MTYLRTKYYMPSQNISLDFHYQTEIFARPPYYYFTFYESVTYSSGIYYLEPTENPKLNYHSSG